MKIENADLEQCQVSAANGQVDCEEISGDIQITIGNGQAKVNYAKNASGIINTRVEVAMGEIDFSGPDNLSAVVEASTAMGSISTALPLNQSTTMMGGSITGTIGKGEGKVVLVTSMGSIRIK